MENLALLITGQLRTFLDNDEFTIVLNRCITTYNKILIIFVLNSDDNTEYELLTTYFSQFNLLDVILINYTDDKFKLEMETTMNNKYDSEIYNTIFSKYKILNTQGFQEIPEPKTTQNSIKIIFHQLSIAVKKLIEYQIQNNINFDVTFQTRSDIKYPENFFPHIPKSNDILDILSFNEENKQLLMNSMKEYNLHTLDDLINFNKANPIRPPNCRIQDKHHWNLSFGHEYVANYQSLEYIKNGNSNIIYSFGTSFTFGKTCNFVLLENLFEYFWMNEPINSNIYCHYYAPETQFIQFCTDNNLAILCYRGYFMLRFFGL